MLLAGALRRRAIWKMLLAGGAIGKKLAGKSAQISPFLLGRLASEAKVPEAKVPEAKPPEASAP